MVYEVYQILLYFRIFLKGVLIGLIQKTKEYLYQKTYTKKKKKYRVQDLWL
jgi:hypothetical protein